MSAYFRPANRLISLKSLALTLALVLVPAAYAQDVTTSPEPTTEQPGPGTIVATVGGEPITEADISFAAEDLAQELQQMPPDQRARMMTMQVKITKYISYAYPVAALIIMAIFAAKSPASRARHR